MNLPFTKAKNVPSKTDMQTPGKQISPGTVTVRDIIAPSAIEVDFDFIKVGNVYFRTLFVVGYPRFIGANWLSPLVNFDHTLEIALYHYPIEAGGVLEDLRRKIAEMEATISADVQKGKVVDPQVQLALDDARILQEELVKGSERFFQFGLYVTIPADTKEELDLITKRVESALGALLIISKHCTLQHEAGFKTTLPLGHDKLLITRNMDTTSLATTFPFTSSELTGNSGIMYGLNENNGSLVIFDRFTLENANSVVFGKAGGGKSYMVKLEALRSLMFGTEIIILDPENEYKTLAEAVGGEYVEFSFSSNAKINPFELSGIYNEEENELGLKILALHGLLKVMLGDLTSTEDAILDRALILTYKAKGITPDPATHKNEPPLIEDLYKALLGMEESQATGLADKLEKFIKGSLRGILDQKTTVDLKNTFTVFGLKELAEELRPTAMYLILDYVWTRIKSSLKKRILVVDEAWYFLKYPDSAMFLYSIAKRARKYYLGLTTITQDVEDFLNSDYGKAIVANSSIQVLLKQSTSSIEKITEVFNISEGERHLLLASDVGEGLFFAGANHVAIRILASQEEHKLITTKPSEILEMQKEAKQLKIVTSPPV